MKKSVIPLFCALMIIFLSLWGGLYTGETVLAACIGGTAIVALLAGYGIAHAAFARRTSPLAGNRDSLTGLLSVSDLESALTGFFKKSVLKDYSLICMDIVAFRRFNTMYGQACGDALLNAVGECLNAKYFCAARVNGDVFVFAARSSREMIPEIEAAINQALTETLGEQYIQLISYKFGIYPLLEDTLHFREAYDGALYALKCAKSAPKLREVFYSREMQRTTRMHKDIEMHMLRALSNGEFEPHIQPKFHSGTMKCCGGEALVRWQSETMGFLLPHYFVPLFEQNGFIAEVDFFMISFILERLREQINNGENVLPISVNQSRITVLFPNYLERLQALLNQYQVPPHYFEIEITESALTENYAMLVSLVHSLREMGVSVAMDDFGTGYSSLNTLRELPFDILKIDQVFLQETDTSQKGRKIIKSVIDMAKVLEIGTVCEGVETGMQMDFLKKAGCDCVQGYLFSRPIPFVEFKKRYLD